MPFSKFKAFLRKVSERTVRGLCRRIGSFVPTLSRAECRNYFRHAGYAPISPESALDGDDPQLIGTTARENRPSDAGKLVGERAIASMLRCSRRGLARRG